MDVSLKDAANCTDGITRSSVNYLSKKKANTCMIYHVVKYE